MSKKIVRLTESDLARIVKRVIMESNGTDPEIPVELMECITGAVGEMPVSCTKLINRVLVDGKIPTNPFDRDVMVCGDELVKKGVDVVESMPLVMECIQNYMSKTGG